MINIKTVALVGVGISVVGAAVYKKYTKQRADSEEKTQEMDEKLREKEKELENLRAHNDNLSRQIMLEKEEAVKKLKETKKKIREIKEVEIESLKEAKEKEIASLKAELKGTQDAQAKVVSEMFLESIALADDVASLKTKAGSEEFRNMIKAITEADKKPEMNEFSARKYIRSLTKSVSTIRANEHEEEDAEKVHGEVVTEEDTTCFITVEKLFFDMNGGDEWETSSSYGIEFTPENTKFEAVDFQDGEYSITVPRDSAIHGYLTQSMIVQMKYHYLNLLNPDMFDKMIETLNIRLSIRKTAIENVYKVICVELEKLPFSFIELRIEDDNEKESTVFLKADDIWSSGEKKGEYLKFFNHLSEQMESEDDDEDDEEEWKDEEEEDDEEEVDNDENNDTDSDYKVSHYETDEEAHTEINAAIPGSFVIRQDVIDEEEAMESAKNFA